MVQGYLEGPLGCVLLAKKDSIATFCQIVSWARAYKKFGMEGKNKGRPPMSKNQKAKPVKQKKDSPGKSS